MRAASRRRRVHRHLRRGHCPATGGLRRARARGDRSGSGRAKSQGEGRRARCGRGRRGSAHGMSGPDRQGPRRRDGGPAGAAHDPKDRRQVPPGRPAAAPQHRRRRAGRGARPDPRPHPHAPPPHLCGLEAGCYAIPGPGGRRAALAEVTRPQDPGSRRGDRRARPSHRSARRGARSRSARPRRRGRRQRGRTDGRRRRKPRPAALRGELRDAMWRLPAARIEREDTAPSPQSRGEPPSQLGPPHDRRVPHAHRPANPRLRRAAHAAGTTC